MNQLLHITPPNLDAQGLKYCKLFEESVINNSTLNQFKIHKRDLSLIENDNSFQFFYNKLL